MTKCFQSSDQLNNNRRQGTHNPRKAGSPFLPRQVVLKRHRLLLLPNLDHRLLFEPVTFCVVSSLEIPIDVARKRVAFDLSVVGSSELIGVEELERRRNVRSETGGKGDIGMERTSRHSN